MPVYVGHTWENPPEPIPASQIAQTVDCDVLVIGAGVAGLAAAEAAAARGAKTVVLEQWSTFTTHGADNCAINTKAQESWGVHFDKALIARSLYNWTQQAANYDLIKTFVYRSAEVFDHINEIAEEAGWPALPGISNTSYKRGWDTLPYPFTFWNAAHSYTSYYQGVHDVETEGLPAQQQLGTILYDKAVETGAEFHFNTHAEQLLRDGEGPVTGAVATAEDGSYVQYNVSKGVILATGDIGGNAEMLECWCPSTLRMNNGKPATGMGNGDGINMGMWIGAAHSRSLAAPIIHPVGGMTIMGPLMMCWTMVDIHGNRPGSEMPLEPHVTDMRMAAPKNTLWFIFDSDYRAAVEQQEPETAEAMVANFEQNREGYLEKGNLLMADTLEELAELMGVPADAMIATIERRNGYCHAGYDPEFEVPERFLSPVEKAPFYAHKVGAANGTTPFGLHVDRNSQVCTDADDPIEGLYAVGNVQGDFFSINYPVMLPGISHGRAITFGALVGAAVADGTKISDVPLELDY